MRNVPPTSASNRSIELVIPSGTIHDCTAVGSIRAQYTASGVARIVRVIRVVAISAGPSVLVHQCSGTKASPTGSPANGRRSDHAARAIHNPEPTIVSMTTAHIA